MTASNPAATLLSLYQKDRPARLDPQAFGFPLTRRHTPGLRRGEVAQRADVARAGAMRDVATPVADLQRLSPEFRMIWAENDVRASYYGEVVKTLRQPEAGLIKLDYSAFAVQGRPDLDMVVYTPATPEDALRVAQLIAARP